jgi:hypothetical protein
MASDAGETYLGPDRTIRELMDYYARNRIKTSFLVEFSAACRKDLAARATAIRWRRRVNI